MMPPMGSPDAEEKERTEHGIAAQSTADLSASTRELTIVHHTATRPATRGRCLRCDATYIRRTWEGRLKLIELILTFSAGVIVPKGVEIYGGHFMFFCVVALTACLVSAVDLVLNLTDNLEYCPSLFREDAFLLILNGVYAIMFLATSALITDVSSKTEASKSRTTVAALLGFAAMVMFGLEAFLYFMKTRQVADQSGMQRMRDETVGDANTVVMQT